jgi:hypothetical protein
VVLRSWIDVSVSKMIFGALVPCDHRSGMSVSILLRPEELLHLLEKFAIASKVARR